MVTVRWDQQTEGNRRSPGVAALVGQELDAGRCSGPILNFLTTFQYLVLKFVSTFLIFGPRLPLYFSLLGPLLFLDFPTTFLIFGVSSTQVSLEKVDGFAGFSRGKLWSSGRFLGEVVESPEVLQPSSMFYGKR